MNKVTIHEPEIGFHADTFKPGDLLVPTTSFGAYVRGKVYLRVYWGLVLLENGNVFQELPTQPLFTAVQKVTLEKE